MSETVLYARDVEKAWKDHRVLDKANLSLKLGRVTAILGPSGAGKSTLLRAIAGLEKIDRGLIQAGDQTLSSAMVHVPPEERGIGLVFQDYALFPHLTALQNVMFGLRGMKSQRRQERAQALLETARLGHKAKSYPHALSGGEQQRVALARALAPNPKLVLMDEAFSGLDARLRDDMRETTLNALKDSGAAVLIVTHDAEEAMFMADDLALMTNGRIIQSGPPDEVYLNPVSPAAARLLGEVNEWTGVVSGGRLATPIGEIAAHESLEGRHAVALVRPEGLQLSRAEKGPCRVIRRRASGAEALMLVEDPEGGKWRARAPLAHALAKGETVKVGIDPALARVVSL